MLDILFSIFLSMFFPFFTVATKPFIEESESESKPRPRPESNPEYVLEPRPVQEFIAIS